MTVYLLIFFLLICCSAFFSSSETAFFSLSKHQRHQLDQSSRRSARRAALLRSQPRALLVTVLFGNELTNIALSIVSTKILLLSGLFNHHSLAEQALISASIVVPTLLILGEITPKSIAALMSERVAILFAYPLSAFAWLITPARWALLKAANAVTKLFGSGSEGHLDNLDEEGFKALIEVGTQTGVLDQDEQALIHNAFQFNDQQVGEVMIPWHEVFVLDQDLCIGDALSEVSNHAYSRIPLWDAEREMVTRVLYAKDLLQYRWSSSLEPEMLNQPVKEISHRVVFTTAQTSLTYLLDVFKRSRKHLAVVIEHPTGEVKGLCTLEDVLEVLFGPIHEESIHSEDLDLEQSVHRFPLREDS